MNMKKLDFTKRQKVRDLIYFDGPLLSHYTIDDEDYFFGWCDLHNNCNIWMVYPVSKEDIKRFLNKEVSEYELVIKQYELYLVDIDKDLNFINDRIFHIDDITPDYLPTKDSYFDKDLM